MLLNICVRRVSRYRFIRLGWNERKPPREFDTTRFDRDILPGGIVSQGYEAFVKSVFHGAGNGADATAAASPASQSASYSQLPAGASALSGNPKVSAAALLKLEEHLGRGNANEKADYMLYVKRAFRCYRRFKYAIFVC